MLIRSDFYREEIISSDKESFLRLALQGNVILYNKIVGQWNHTGTNESNNQSFNDTLENLKWIKNVYPYLRKQVGTQKAIFWKFRMKLAYASPITRAVRTQNKLTVKQIFSLIKARMIFVLSLRQQEL